MTVLADYVWKTQDGFRWKTRVFDNTFILDNNVKPNFPKWDFNGASTGQSNKNKNDNTISTEMVLSPAFVCNDPMRPGYTHPRHGENFCSGYIVLCDVTYQNGKPVKDWNRQWAKTVFDANIDKVPMFGMKQEYYIFDPRTRTPMGFPNDKSIRQQGLYYGRMGEHHGRGIAEKHMEMCLSAGLNISGMNSNVGPSQWEYNIGFCEGIEAADQLMVSRYLLERIGESASVAISWNPKPIVGEWNGSGCNVLYSTKYTRCEVENETDGYNYIKKTISNLEALHSEMLLTFSNDNRTRLDGKNDSSLLDNFTWGVGTYNTSVSLPSYVMESKKGYIIDMRPGADMDPYLTTATILHADTLK
jgi:glutamine synthetase